MILQVRIHFRCELRQTIFFQLGCGLMTDFLADGLAEWGMRETNIKLKYRDKEKIMCHLNPFAFDIIKVPSTPPRGMNHEV